MFIIETSLAAYTHEPIGHRQTILQFKAYKFYCHDCRRYFNQQFPGIHKHQRSTQRLQNHIFHRHTEGASQKSLAHDFKLGKATHYINGEKR